MVLWQLDRFPRLGPCNFGCGDFWGLYGNTCRIGLFPFEKGGFNFSSHWLAFLYLHTRVRYQPFGGGWYILVARLPGGGNDEGHHGIRILVDRPGIDPNPTRCPRVTRTRDAQ